MHFTSGINRPPYETADGYLQTTQGCSHNSCLFCTYFKEPPFQKSSIEEIKADIAVFQRADGGQAEAEPHDPLAHFAGCQNGNLTLQIGCGR